MQQLVAEISLRAIRFNARAMAHVAGVPLIAVVKDDAYGHGAEAVALALQGGVSAFAVSTVQEGAALRCAGITEDILVLTPPLNIEEGLRLVSYGLIGSVTSLPAMKMIAAAGEQTASVPRVHIAVNTGMNRYGVRPERAGKAAERAKTLGLSVEGVYSHLYEPSNCAAVSEQQQLFYWAAEEVRKVFPNCMRHLSATGGVLAGGEFYDTVRVGLALYGYLPQMGNIRLRKAMKVYATVSHRCTQLGGGVGYACAERSYGQLHTLRLGYGDGFFRGGMDGVIGKLCMDAAICKGDAAFGNRRRVLPDLEAYARAHNTSVYEVLVNISARAVKKYI